ncbi:MAG: hypothetical protein QF781_04555 [Phycisphaerales bacterium]|jgi:hypothetical protein|nr:hypothetical protein [Phycisphaerales bacterium]MDP6311416.1 hypothetical protein [Phycisphaerales bacterium]MDP7087134.1 hypothetical protein [Phycisphaerales bacterium]MDP7188369.1 hypothetical protein [Phycisphaerales bacterium]MDP7518618.1 hypothetical protein [Phycisphaerales bacterium]|tara:strand:- start:2303 stop:2785 length:483 start_codon:yes stop_codon:yes gene_type:complete
MESRLGHLLVRNGVLEARQVTRALAEQSRTGAPFGLVCERLFGTDPRDIERAWADQYASLTQTVDLARESLDPAVLALITRRQAWQFGIVPIRWDEGELMVATIPSLLVRAHRFVARTVDRPAFFVMTSRTDLLRTLGSKYPLPGAMLPDAGHPPARTAA